MYTFTSIIKKSRLNAEYMSLFKHDLDKKWNKQVKACPALANAMLPGMTAKQLLVADFEKLVDVYKHYLEYIEGLSDVEKMNVETAAKSVFTYKSFTPRIAEFLADRNNGFEIHNCVYCDTVKVSSFKHRRGEKIRRFQTEHVLNKGKCPLVALSLYNFVPSCVTCNGANLKGTNTIGDTVEEIKLLSPTNKNYDFWHKVLFVVNPKNNINEIGEKRTEHPECYEIDFYFKDKKYSKSIELFALKERYNEDYLNTALTLLDDKDKFTNKYLEDVAQIDNSSPNEVYERYFRVEKDRRENATYRKAKEDILGLTKTK